MLIRRSLAVLLTAGLVVTAAACADDDTETSEPTDTSAPAEEMTTTTLSDDEYSEAVEAAEGHLEDAGTDLCAMGEATSTPPPPPPANPAQVEQFVGLYRATYDAAAGTLEDEDPQSAAALREGGAALEAAAEEADYSIDFVSPESQPEALTSPEFVSALEALQARFSAECAESIAPEGAPDTIPADEPAEEPAG